MAEGLEVLWGKYVSVSLMYVREGSASGWKCIGVARGTTGNMCIDHHHHHHRECVIHHGRLLVTQPDFSYGVSSELIDRSLGRAETTSHTTHRDSVATTPRVTSHTYLLLLLLCG